MKMYEILAKIITESWQVLGQMSPYLLFGFLVAGVLSVCVSPEWVERHLGRRGFGPVLKASLFGVPLPLCSCGVIPVSASLRRHGASRAATTAFLLSTPQTGVDSIAVTYALLGPVFAIFRPIAALLTGFVGGGLVQVFGEPDGRGTGVFCRNGPKGALHERLPSPSYDDELVAADCTEACCADARERSVLFRVLRYGFVTLPRDIGAALLVGIVIAGTMAVLVPQDHMNAYIGGGVVSILLLMAVGVPVYVCATASVPIAAGLLHMGASPGAALAFLIAGPATNAATFTTIWKLLGRRTAILYLMTVAVSAIIFGLVLNGLIPVVESALPQLGSHAHAAAQGSWLHHASAVVLLAVLAFSYCTAWTALQHTNGKEAAEEESRDVGNGVNQCRLELVVTGMTCSHCTETVRRVLVESTGVRSAEVDLSSGRAIVRGRNLDPDPLVAAVAGLGYAARAVEEAD